MPGRQNLAYLHTRYSELPADIKDKLFDPEKLKQAGLIKREVQGRGTTYFFDLRGTSCVLRHYWRGGAVRRLSRDLYFWCGLKRSRPFREWQLLTILEKLQLPAPRPVAMRIQRTGLFYRSDIITEEITGVESLADLLRTRPATREEWRRIGKTIRAFHDHHVMHQDLNAMNILLGAETCHLIDFDRGQIFMGDSWHTWVLARLLRSLNKLNNRHDPFHFTEFDWEYLVNGYAEPSPASGSG